MHTFDVEAMTRIMKVIRPALIGIKRSHRQVPLYMNKIRSRCLSSGECEWCQILANKGYGAIAYLMLGGCNDMRAYYTIMEILSYADLSLTIKYGVQFCLLGKHCRLRTENIVNISIGSVPSIARCFTMTETGHGSSLKDWETTATYIHDTRSFIIHTPYPFSPQRNI